jgi:hypothetical protein
MNNFKSIFPKIRKRTQNIVESVYFELKFKELHIGTLKFEKDLWSFSYTEEFKNQNSFDPIVPFPDLNKVYESANLWSFFSSRIPDMETSSEKKEKQNELYVEQLKTYGRKTITNPYDLLAVG